MAFRTNARWLALLWIPLLAAQDREYARSMVISDRGIAATAHVQASVAAAKILERGGSAVDSAIAANAVLGVTEMMMNGMGGDLFAIYRDAKTGALTGINASGWAPKRMTVEYLRARRHLDMPSRGIDSVTVPGCVDGWAKMHQRFGKLPWKDLFQPAIWYAEHGAPVPELIRAFWEGSAAVLRADPNAARLFLPGGLPPFVGDTFRNPELARAYRILAEQGPDAFYRGEIARAILRTSERLGGALDATDLAEFSSEWVTPLSTTYRGWTVSELPPNGMGVGALAMLGIMENFPLPEMPALSAEAIHIKIEAQKLAYQDMRVNVADPRFAALRTADLLSKSYAKQRAAAIRRDRAVCDARPGVQPRTSSDTTYLAVADREGNVVTWIQSISEIFGSGIVVDGMGFHLHDRGASFSMDPASPNVVAPRKRPFHTIIPGFLEKDDLHIGFGIMSGLNQATAHAQFVSNIVDHRMNLQAALEAPRFTKRTFNGCDVEMESRVTAETRATLAKLGHEIAARGAYSARMGGGHAVMHDSKARINYGASSPRKDGAAVPEAPNYWK